jgi:hypothetical protein
VIEDIEMVLFQCHWFDPTKGTRSEAKLGLVEIKSSSRLANFEPFAMAHQATQAYYLQYPSPKRDLRDWWVVYKIQPSSSLSNHDDNAHDTSSENQFFQEESQLGSLSVDIENFIDEATASTDRSDDVLDASEIETLEKHSRNEHPLGDIYSNDSSDDEEEIPPQEEREDETEEDEDEDNNSVPDSEYDNDDY